MPNSPLNRYFQVKDSEASNNSFINCDYIQFCAGSDAERSAVPVNSTVKNNLFYNETKNDLFTVYDDISGITFEGNVLSENIKPIAPAGFANEKLEFERDENGVLIPKGTDVKAGIAEVVPHATPENTGVSWYPRTEQEVVFNHGKTISVPPGTNTLFDAMKDASPGDIFELSEGEYLMTKAINIYHPVTIKGVSSEPTLLFQKNSLFNIENGGAISLQNLNIDGAECPDYSGNSVVRTSRYSMNRNYKLFIEDCDFSNLDVNHSFNVLKIYKSTFADSVVLRNSTFKNISGAVIALDEEDDGMSIYNSENIVIDNCHFEDIDWTALNIVRDGRDESTFGPMVVINNTSFKNVGKDKRNKAGASVVMVGVQYINISGCEFDDSAPIKMHLVVGDPVINIKDSKLINTDKVVTHDGSYGADHFNNIWK